MKTSNEIGSFDAILDEKYGKIGTAEREVFNREAYTYCVGQMILDARKQERMTQSELAQRIGSNKSYISKIENGYVEPSAGLFLKIITALGLRFELVKTCGA